MIEMEMEYKTYKQLNIGTKRTEDELKRIAQCIGGPSNRRSWDRTSFKLTPMQLAIIDTLYDAGPDVTMRPKDMVNDLTREAWVLSCPDHGWTDAQVQHRLQVSCGHDERDTELIILYDFSTTEMKENRSGPVRTKVGEFYLDEGPYAHEDVEFNSKDDVYKWAQKKAHDYKFVGETDDSYRSRMPNYYFDWYDNHNYKGECLWEDKVIPDLPEQRQGKSNYAYHLRCKHHQGPQYEYAIVKRTDYSVFYDEQDLQPLIDAVDDKDVLSLIKETIPKMKTEARQWLQSTHVHYAYRLKDESQPDVYANREYYSEQRGKRGHYSLAWWEAIVQVTKAMERGKKILAREGEVINGWVLKVERSSDGNHQGEWANNEEIFNYNILCTGSGSRSTGNVGSFLKKSERDQWFTILKGMDCVQTNRNEGHFKKSFNPVTIALAYEADPSQCTPVEVLTSYIKGDQKYSWRYVRGL
jgi:hypothetical protein